MAAEQLSAAATLAALASDQRRERRTRLTGFLLVSPALLLTALFLLFPLVFILQMSFTTGRSFLSAEGATFTTQNFTAMATRVCGVASVTPTRLSPTIVASRSSTAHPSVLVTRTGPDAPWTASGPCWPSWTSTAVRNCL